MKNVKVKVADFIERVGWTAIQAGGAAALAALTSSNITWITGVKMVAYAAAIAALKVIIAQNAGKSNDGSLPDTTTP